MSDFLFGWFTGLMTIVVPYLSYEVYRLRKHVKLLANPEEKPLEKKKPWWKI